MFVTIGVLLRDLLVAEDLAAAETTSAASHAAAAAVVFNMQQENAQVRYRFTDNGTRATLPETAADGEVLVGSPVVTPVSGDIFRDISTENATLQGSR